MEAGRRRPAAGAITPEGNVAMSRQAGEEWSGRGVLTGTGSNQDNVRALEMMLDYAILEGAALRRPLFVLLLRAARLELTAGAAGGAGVRRGGATLEERVMADEAACLLAARDVLDGCSHPIQDR